MTIALDDKARAILRSNDKGSYTIPTSGLYPYQWNWDSAFAALGFASFDMNRAWIEIETLMGGQWDDGMVPHILFHQKDDGYFPGPDVWGCHGPIASSGITQPPVALSVVAALYLKDPDGGAKRFSAIYEGCVRWAKWFFDWRSDEGAIFVTHPWESGRDNAVDWDDAMAQITPEGIGEYRRRDTDHVDASMRPTKYDYDRYLWLVQRGRAAAWDPAILARDNPFRVLDPTTHFILMRGIRDLAAIGRDLGHDTRLLDLILERLTDGVSRLVNPKTGFFDGRNLNTGQWTNALSNAAFLCWYAGVDTPHMRDLLREVLDGARYGVPSLAPVDKHFDPVRYWRGPVWAIMNMMIAQGLSAYGYPEGARIRLDTRTLIAESGFSEYFNPLSGAAAGGKNFTWTAAVWLADW